MVNEDYQKKKKKLSLSITPVLSLEKGGRRCLIISIKRFDALPCIHTTQLCSLKGRKNCYKLVSHSAGGICWRERSHCRKPGTRKEDVMTLVSVRRQCVCVPVSFWTWVAFTVVAKNCARCGKVQISGWCTAELRCLGQLCLLWPVNISAEMKKQDVQPHTTHIECVIHTAETWVRT